MEICEILVGAGGCVHARTTSGGATPLHRAAYCNHTKVIFFIYLISHFLSSSLLFSPIFFLFLLSLTFYLLSQ